MKKFLIRLTTFLAALTVTAPLSACSENGNDEKNETAEVWGTYSTAKIGQDSSNNEKFVKNEARLDVQMMKNESEGGQIIVTAAKDYDSFDLEVSDLKTADGKVFAASNVTAYQEKYIQVRQKRDYNDMYVIGEYVPDMLLPLSVSKQYGENVIKKGNNQGIYVEFSSAGVPAGKYTGAYKLTVGSEKYEIPVSVEVWDIEYAGRRNFQSCFVLYQSSLLKSEYDNSDEMTDAYTQFFLDYKVDVCLHNFNRNDFSSYGEKWLQSVEKYKDNPNFNSVYIPYQFAPNYTAYTSAGTATAAAEQCIKYVTALAKTSSAEYPYIDYAYFYPFELDEADVVTRRQPYAENLLKQGGEIEQTLQLAVDRLESEGYFDSLSDQAYAEHLKQAILNIPTIFTNVNFKGDWVDSYDACFCPYLSVFNSGASADHYLASANESGKDVWAYTCVGPNYPYPTFHLDDYNLGTRISGWMEKYYGINGYLYWSASNASYSGEEYKYLDPYEDADRYPGADGDGYLVYPGSYYGLKTPLPSLRLVAYRDSMDDYDMLCVYESLLKAYYKKYDLGELDFNDYAEHLYAELFTGAIYDTDDAKLFAAREELASRIAALSGDEEILVTKKTTAQGCFVEIYSNVWALDINGATQMGEKTGKDRYKYTLTDAAALRSVTVSTDNRTEAYEFFAANVQALSPSNVSAGENSEVTVTDGAAQAVLRSVLKGDEIGSSTVAYNPYVTFALDKKENAKYVCFTIANLSGTATDFYFDLTSGLLVNEIGSAYLKAGASKRVRIKIPDGITVGNGAELTVRVPNVFMGENNEYELYADRTVSVSDVYFECE
ncbi:MAG: DUF4091 domain-containing protein [Candidatus Borkfalkiaceae bacterium]|nr:DUF4091 domain-containing protein [Clostridia bacterium]MDY6224103.1 DUF4091 domain-containing protein [Christensenellaceae bacterium]